MLRSDERWIIHMEAEAGWVPHTAPNTMDIEELTTILKEVPGTTLATQRVDAGDEYVTLDAVELVPSDNPKALVLLLSCTNKAAADPGFRNVVNGSNRTEAKKLDEGISSSAHLVLSLEEKIGADGSYWPCVLEDVPNIGKTKIQAALTTMINARRNFHFKIGEKVEPAFPRFRLHGQESQDLIDDLEAGQMSYFVAVKNKKPSKKFDDIPGIEAQSQTQKFKVEKNFKPEGGFGKFLNDITGAGKSAGFSKIKLTYVRNDGRTKTHTLGTHREDAEDFLIKKVERLDMAEHPQPQMHKIISQPLVTKMIEKLL